MRQDAGFSPRPSPRARLAALGVAVLVALAPARGRAQAAELELDAGECPAEALVREQLEPLLAGEGLTADGVPVANGQRARVQDLGDRYVVEIGAARREASDPARDCLERARVVAVFIALNLRLAPPPLPPATPAPPVAPDPRPARALTPPAPRLGVHGFIEAAYAPEAALVTMGPGLGLTLRGAAWTAALAGAVLLPAELELEPGATSRGAVTITRAPFALTLMPSWRVGSLELGPFAGAALDVLSFQGQRLERSASALRVSPGVTLGLGARWLLSRTWRAFMNLAATAFPMEYRLRVEPTGTLGHAPQSWLGWSLGIEAGRAP